MKTKGKHTNTAWNRNTALVSAITIGMFLAVLPRADAAIVPPFNQAPPVGSDTSASTLIVFDNSGTLTVFHDPTQGPFDGVEDTLVAIQNNSTSQSLQSVVLSSTKPIFGFDGDGIQAFLHPGNPTLYGPTGYEGPGVTFTIVDQFNGKVSFAGGLAPGQSAYFGLEEDVNSAGAIVPTLPQASPVPEPASGLTGLACLFLVATSFFSARSDRSRLALAK